MVPSYACNREVGFHDGTMQFMVSYCAIAQGQNEMWKGGTRYVCNGKLLGWHWHCSRLVRYSCICMDQPTFTFQPGKPKLRLATALSCAQSWGQHSFPRCFKSSGLILATDMITTSSNRDHHLLLENGEILPTWSPRNLVELQVVHHQLWMIPTVVWAGRYTWWCT